MFSVTSTQTMPILATYNPNGKISITASAIGEDLGNTFRTHIVEQKDPRFLYAIARAVTADIPNKNKDMFPLDEIKRAYTTFIGRNIFLDHNTTSVRNAVGKIIAAELREDEEGQTYVACLFKIDRELHPDIARKIENGIIDSVSMGANVQQTTCVFPQTKLFTPDGQRMIKDIHIGDYVLTHKGHFRQVTATFKNKCPETMVRVKYADGSDVKVLNIGRQRPYGSRLDLTGNHPVLMESGEWLPAKYLQPGDKVMCLVKGCLQCGKPLLYNYPWRNFCCKECKSAYILEQYPENIEKAKQRFKYYWRNLSVEQKEQIAQESAERAKSWWANLTPDEYAERCKVGHVALRKFFDTPSVKRDAEIERRIKFGKELFSNPENVEKASKRLKALYKNFAVNKRSKLEVKFENELISRGYTDFSTNAYKCLNGKRMYPDFVFEDKKIIIEIDGEYWHNKEACKKKDQLHTKLMEEAGYTVLRFTGTQVIKYLSECVDTFERVYNNHAGNYRFAPMEVLSVETYKTTPRTNDVYNLSVEEDESYIAENLVVHNCSICSNIATREADFCQHQKAPSLYSNYYAINRGVEFTELSLVSVPADPSAKMHKVFDMHNGMQKVAVGEADLTTVQKSGEQPEETVTKTDTNEVPVQPQREDLPQPDTIKVEQPVKEVKGKVYQIDCSSNESADFIYNILHPYLNKGIEELIITGRGVKVFFDEQVKDPEIFVGEACSLFGLMMEKGIADQKAVASYDAFLKVQAKVEEVRFSSLLIDNEQFPLYVKYEDRVRSKGEHNVTIIIDGIKSFLGKYDDQFLKNEIADAFLAIPHVKSSKIAQSPNGEYKNHLAIKLVLDTDWSDFAPEMGQFVGIAKDVFTKAQDSKNKKKQEKKEVKDEKLLGLSDAASKKFLNAFSKETRKPTALWGIIKSGLADTTESPITVLKQNKDILTKLSDTRYNTILGAAFNSLIRNKVNDTELVDSDGNVDKEKALAIFKEVGIEDKQEFDAYANYLKSLGMEGDTGFGKFVNSVVMDKDSYINNFSGEAPKVVEESAEELVTPKEEPIYVEPTDVKKGKGNPELHDLLNEEKPVEQVKPVEDTKVTQEEKPTEDVQTKEEPTVENVVTDKKEDSITEEPKQQTQDFTATLTQMENILSAMKAGGLLDKEPKTVAKALVNTLKGLGADIQSSLEKAKESLKTKGMSNAIYDAAMMLANTDKQSTDALKAINDLFKEGKDTDLATLANTLLGTLGVKLSDGFVVKDQDSAVENAKKVLEYSAANLDNVENADKAGQAIDLAIKKLTAVSTEETAEKDNQEGKESAEDTDSDKQEQNEQAAKQKAFNEAKETAETAKEKQDEKVDELDGFDYQIWHVTVTKFNDATMDEIIHQLRSALSSLSAKEVERVSEALKPFAENGPFFNENAKSGNAELDTKFTHREKPDRYFTLNFKKLGKKQYSVEGHAYLNEQINKALALQEGESFKDVVMYGYNSAMDFYMSLLNDLAKKQEESKENITTEEESAKQGQTEQATQENPTNKEVK